MDCRSTPCQRQISTLHRYFEGFRGVCSDLGSFLRPRYPRTRKNVKFSAPHRKPRTHSNFHPTLKVPDLALHAPTDDTAPAASTPANRRAPIHAVPRRRRHTRCTSASSGIAAAKGHAAAVIAHACSPPAVRPQSGLAMSERSPTPSAFAYAHFLVRASQSDPPYRIRLLAPKAALHSAEDRYHLAL